MYELCCMLIVSFSSPYVHGYITILYIFLANHFGSQVLLYRSLCFVMYVHAWPAKAAFRIGVVLIFTTLCSHSLMQLTFNLFLSAFTVLPADQSATVLPAVIGSVGGVLIIAAVSVITLVFVCLWIGKG